MSKKIRTVIGVPGRWRDRKDILASIVNRSDGYVFAGMAMVKIGANDAFSLEVYDHDPDLRRAFSIAGRGRLRDEDLDAIDSHTFILYLAGEGGSIDAAKKLLHAANALLKAGGLAVKIESAGTAYRGDQWAEFCANDHVTNLLQAYVALVGGKGSYYSCGMHNLGLADAAVDAEISADDAANLLHTFLAYVLVENPCLHDRETFSVGAHATRYRLFHEPCTAFEAGSLFHNPLGVWKLVPA